jgi:uncharacterized protein
MPERSCTACRKKADTDHLIRLIEVDERGVAADLRGRLPGRGGYACPDAKCLTRAASGAVSRALKSGVRHREPAALVREVGDGLKRMVRERLGVMKRRQGLIIGYKETSAASRAEAVEGAVVAVDLGNNARSGMDAMSTPVYTVATQDELGAWLGRGPTGVVGIPKGQFGARILVDAARYDALRKSQQD